MMNRGRARLVLLLLGSVDDGDELLSNEGSTTDEETVDVGLSSKLVSSGRSDGATIDDTDAVSDGSRDVLAEPVTGPDVGLLSLVGSGGLASADSPDRLVGDDDTGPVLRLLDALSKSGHLGGDDVLGLVGLTLGKKLTDAEDDVQAVVESGGGLLSEELVSLAKDVTTLAVAKKSPLEAEVGGGGGRELTGEGAGLDVAVLSADGVAGLDVSGHIGDVEGLGGDDDIDDVGSRDLLDGIVEVRHELLDRLDSAVALPVATNEELPHIAILRIEKLTN